MDFENGPTQKVPRGPEHIRVDPTIRASLTEKLKSGRTPGQAYKWVNRYEGNFLLSETFFVFFCILFDFLYREAVIESSFNSNGDNPAQSVRNKHMVYNCQKKLNQKKAHDDIFESFLFALQHDGIIWKLELLPELVAVQSHPEMIAHLYSLQSNFKKLVFHYDTTFNVGKFFVSILSMRHPVFKDEPMIPIATMYHASTRQECHEDFFKIMQSTWN